MAAIDSLLRLILVRNAELLILSSGEVPVLRKSGEAMPLSMPPLGAPLVASMVNEVLDDPARAKLASTGVAEVRYAPDGGAAFSLSIERRGDGHRIACRPSTDAPPPVAKPVPVPAPRPQPAVFEAAAPPTELIRLLQRAVHEHASDLLLSTGQAPRMRVAGELVELDAPPVRSEQILALLGRDLDASGSTDAALDLPDGTRFRLNVFRQRSGLGAALRPIRSEIPTLAQLHLPADLHDLTRYSSGLVLVTGRAGSGKSTTLAALIEHLNTTRARHIITLEDPIEYAYQPRRCLIHQREVGAQVESFAGGLRAALRESPDVILVGEMRDRETIAAALTAAETGHLVLSTMHCASAAGAIDRIIDVFPENQQQQVRWQLALALRAVLAQVLVPGQVPPARFPAHEKLIVTTAVASQIRDGKLHHLASSIQTGRDAGMVPLERTLAALVQSGKVSWSAARDAAFDPAALDELLPRRG